MTPSASGRACKTAFTTVLALGLAFSPSPQLRAADVKEPFLNVSEGALLTTLPQWVHVGDDPDAWTLAGQGPGGSGGAIEAATKGTYHRPLKGGEEITASTPPRTFRFKIRFTGSEAWETVKIDLLEAGGVNGCGLRFDGGEADGSSDNKVGLSSGGASWGDVQYAWSNDAHWTTNVWYQVEVTGLALSGGGVTGTVSVFNAEKPDEKLVDRQPLAAYGSGLQKIDILSIGASGAARTFQVGAIELVAQKPSDAAAKDGAK
ncbi:MAG TPA: hypothetical protein VIM58_05760 [Candidatus Methylacidiphilales bacterium]